MKDDAEALVTAIYRVLLLREPDAAGLRVWAGHLEAHTLDFETLLGKIVSGDEFAAQLPRLMQARVPKAAQRFTNDVSQNGEVPLLLRAMVNEAATHRIVVDVGANGRERSNSYDLMRHFGWRGVLVEANPRLLPTIATEFDGLDYVLVNRAVSDYDGRATFHLGINSDVSSLNRANTQAWGAVHESFEVEVERLPNILRPLSIPFDFDLLSIDAEGEDLRIFADVVTAGYRPRWVIIEAADGGRNTSLEQLALPATVRDGYRVVGSTLANLILRAVAPS